MTGEVQLNFCTFGRAGAQRLLVLVGLGDSVVNDPAPSLTAGRGVRVMAAQSSATWFRDHLASARVEMPGATQLSISEVWERTLSHLAPEESAER